VPARVGQASDLRTCTSPRPSGTDTCGSITGCWFCKPFAHGGEQAPSFERPGRRQGPGWEWVRCVAGTSLGRTVEGQVRRPGASLPNLPLLDQGRRSAPPRPALFAGLLPSARPSAPAARATCSTVLVQQSRSATLASTLRPLCSCHADVQRPRVNRLVCGAAVLLRPRDTRLPGRRTGVECVHGLGAWLVAGIARRPPATRPAQSPWMEPNPSDHPPERHSTRSAVRCGSRGCDRRSALRQLGGLDRLPRSLVRRTGSPCRASQRRLSSESWAISRGRHSILFAFIPRRPSELDQRSAWDRDGGCELRRKSRETGADGREGSEGLLGRGEVHRGRPDVT
jgi:hypothetical protein